MEDQNQILDSQLLENSTLGITEAAIKHLQEAGKWCRFLSIVGFIGIGLMALAGVIFGAAGSALGSSLPFPSSVFTLIYLLLAALYFMPVWYLLQFSKKIKMAINHKNTDDFTEAFSDLKSLYKFMGIVTIIILSMYLLFIVFAVVGGVAI